ncbi:Mak10 subunit, NatC N-terminal acetyltransferase-domain-containing protein [Mortierella sp. GBAus27b]|nr:hypothetical protein BGX31_004991 [Mortierella sp. GBA43]KAI8362898.1 Mak10 subunit, NatC N-terminal acetyltransferase-domain-containing protein [Mortierella sp. GBAus27b]
MDQDASDNSAQRTASRTVQHSLNTGSVYPYEDVTELLEMATKDMKVGQLVRLESFSLFDAMCAIVIMDPKMDTGMVIDENGTRPPYDVNRPVNPKEFIWIFDNILVGMATWLSGHALSQTVFTSCYVLRLSEIPELDSAQDDIPPDTLFVSTILRTCVLAVAKSCGLIWTEMKKGQVYDEEDFMINKFGVSLYENFPFRSMMVLLDQAECWMEGSGKQWIESQYESETSNILESILSRIRYARSSYLALYQLITADSSAFSQAAELLVDMQKRVQDIKSTHSLGIQVEGAFDYTVHRKLVSNTPPRTIALLTPKEAFENLDRMCEDILFIRQALSFSDATNLVNFFRQFASKKPGPGAFPRSILQTVLYSDRVIMGCRKVQDVIRDSIQEIVDPPEWIFEDFDDLQAQLAATTLDDIVESLHGDQEQSILRKQISTKAVLFTENAIKPFVDTLQIAGQNTSRQRRNLRKIVQLWESLQEEAEAFDEEIHSTMELTQDRPPPFYFVSWVYNMKLWVMEWLLLLGFELELYSTFEYSMIYGYVHSVLGSHIQHIRRIRRIQAIAASSSQLHASDSQAVQPGEPIKKKKKKPKKKKKKGTGAEGGSQPGTQPSSDAIVVPEDDVDSEPEPTPSTPAITSSGTGPTMDTISSVSRPSSQLIPAIQSEEELVNIRTQLAHGVFLVLAALTHAGYLTATPSHLESHGLNDLETLYCHRFKAFRHLSSPESMSFEGFLRQLNYEGLIALHILKDAGVKFDEARSDLERLQALTANEARTVLCDQTWRADIKNMIRVCIANKIAITAMEKDQRVLSQMAPAASKKAKHPSVQSATPAKKVNFEWKYHTYWPVISLV